MLEKKCRKCGLLLNCKSLFYDSNKNICKKCRCKQQKEYRDRNKKKITDYYRKWYATKGRNRSAKSKEQGRLWHKKNPQKSKAQHIFNRALKNHKKQKVDRCYLCNGKYKLCAHHENYENPLEVIWLCYSCHKKIHQ